MEKVLEVNNLNIGIYRKGMSCSVVNDLSFSINEGETLGIVGESGCGKTMTALSIMRLLPNNIEITSGNILFKDSDLLEKTDKEIRRICGKDIGMVFQEPMTSLNPLLTIEEQIGESLKYHLGYDRQQRRTRILELLGQVGISYPEKRIRQYPHEFSGGLRQRVMIAMALACIIQLIRNLKKQYHNSLLLITHNWGIIAELADKVLVMYAGEAVEIGTVSSIFKQPLHPYTNALLEAVEQLNEGTDRLKTVPGAVPQPGEKHLGCRFADRCDFAKVLCKQNHPELLLCNDGRQIRCWKGTKEYAESK